MTTTRLIWNLKTFAIRWTLPTKCVGGGGGGEINSLNTALLGGLPLAYLGCMKLHRQHSTVQGFIKKVTSKCVGFQVQCAKMFGIAQMTLHVTAMT